MAVKEENTRITLTINKELLEQVDELSKLQGTNRNVVISNLINMSIEYQTKLWKMMKDPNYLTKFVDFANIMGSPEQAKQFEEFKELLTNPTDEQKEDIKKVDKYMDNLEVVKNSKTKKNK